MFTRYVCLLPLWWFLLCHGFDRNTGREKFWSTVHMPLLSTGVYCMGPRSHSSLCGRRCVGEGDAQPSEWIRGYIELSKTPGNNCQKLPALCFVSIEKSLFRETDSLSERRRSTQTQRRSFAVIDLWWRPSTHGTHRPQPVVGIHCGRRTQSV